MEEIVDFKHSEPIIARKGLRKFKDLLPEYLENEASGFEGWCFVFVCLFKRDFIL